MPIELQSVLLRTIQEKEIRRVGAQKISMWISASSPPATRTWKNSLRTANSGADLYYRLNTLKLTMPDLETRKKIFRRCAEYFPKTLFCQVQCSNSTLSPGRQ